MTSQFDSDEDYRTPKASFANQVILYSTVHYLLYQNLQAFTIFFQDGFSSHDVIPELIYFSAAFQVAYALFADKGRLSPLRSMISSGIFIVSSVQQTSHKQTYSFYQKNCFTYNYLVCLNHIEKSRLNITACEIYFPLLGKRVQATRRVRRSVARLYYCFVHKEHYLYLLAKIGWTGKNLRKARGARTRSIARRTNLATVHFGLNISLCGIQMSGKICTLIHVRAAPQIYNVFSFYTKISTELLTSLSFFYSRIR